MGWLGAFPPRGWRHGQCQRIRRGRPGMLLNAHAPQQALAGLANFCGASFYIESSPFNSPPERKRGRIP